MNGPDLNGPDLNGLDLNANDYDVAVVGGGPVGMWLAAELHRAGVRPVVLERRRQRPPHSKALTIYPRTVEEFALRGLAGRWLAEGRPVPSSHFALLKNRLDFAFLDAETRYPYTLFLPQRRTEELLEEHLAELGVPYLRQHAVTALRPTPPDPDADAGVDARRRRARRAASSSAPPTWPAATAPRAWSARPPESTSREPPTAGRRSSATSS